MFSNATGNAEDEWKSLKYADLLAVSEKGLAMQQAYSNINTDSVELSAFRDRGAKVISYHGLSDQLIMPQGSLNYFDRLVEKMGGLENVHTFNRLFLIPGMGHSGSFNQSASVGINGTVTQFRSVPLPQSSTGRDEMFNALRAWVEKGISPERIELTAASGTFSLPICVHPKKAVFTGSNMNAATSYSCQ